MRPPQAEDNREYTPYLAHTHAPGAHAHARHRLRGIWSADGDAGRPAARLSVRSARLRRHAAHPGRCRLPRRSCPTCAATGRRGSWRRRRRGRVSRRRWARTCSTSWTRSTCRRRRWLGTTGAGAPRASSRRCGPSACAGWSPSAATTSRTSPRSVKPAAPEQEHRLWYQYYFHTERGRAGLSRQSVRAVPPAVAAVVAHLVLRRRDLRPQRRVVRQP